MGKPRYGVILPDRLGMNEQFIQLRNQILSEFCLEKIIYGYPFPGIITDTGIFIISNSGSTSSYLGCRYPSDFIEIPSERVKKDKLCSFTVTPDSNYSSLGRLKTTPLVSGGVCSTFVGFIAGKGMLQGKSFKGASKAIKGRDFFPFKVESNHYIKLDKSSFIGGTQDLKKLCAKPKILIRKTGNKIIAALEENGTAIEQSVYALFNFKGINPKALVCFFNSSMATDYYMSYLVTNQSSTPQLKKIHLDQFPIPKELILENEKKLIDIYNRAVKSETIEGFIKKIDKIFETSQKKKKK